MPRGCSFEHNIRLNHCVRRVMNRDGLRNRTELAGYAIKSIFVSIIINMFISHANLACRNKKECRQWMVVRGMYFVRPTISN